MTSVEKVSNDLARGMARERKKSRRLMYGLLAVLLAFFTLAGIMFGLWLNTLGEKEQSDSRAANEEQQKVEVIEEKQEVLQEARLAVCSNGDREIYDRELCEKWAAQMADVGVPEASEPDTITQAELVSAFQAYCVGGKCKGADGKTPTVQDTAAAFAQFCSTRDDCRGPEGEAADPLPPLAPLPPADPLPPVGPPLELVIEAVSVVCADGACRGEKGDTGDKGAQGDPPGPEVVAASVAEYCAANNNCAGPPGANGADGQPGRGVASVQCDSPTPVTFTFTFTDGTSETTQCAGAAPPPAPEPDPTEEPGPPIGAP